MAACGLVLWYFWLINPITRCLHNRLQICKLRSWMTDTDPSRWPETLKCRKKSIWTRSRYWKTMRIIKQIKKGNTLMTDVTKTILDKASAKPKCLQTFPSNHSTSPFHDPINSGWIKKCQPTCILIQYPFSHKNTSAYGLKMGFECSFTLTLKVKRFYFWLKESMSI